MKLEELKRLCDEATRGPWEAIPDRRREPVVWHYIIKAGTSNSHDDADTIAPVFFDDEEAGVRANDAAFIIAARTMLPKLIAVAEAVKARQAQAQTECTCEYSECESCCASFIAEDEALAALESE